MNSLALILHALPSLIAGLLIGRIATERLPFIRKLKYELPICIALGITLFFINFFVMKNYAVNLSFFSYDPRLVVCHILSGGILILDLDLLINSRFRLKNK